MRNTNYKFSTTVRDYYNCYFGIDDIEDWTPGDLYDTFDAWDELIGDEFDDIRDVYNFIMDNLDKKVMCSVEYDSHYGNYTVSFKIKGIEFLEVWIDDPKTSIKNRVQDFIIDRVGENYKSFRYNDFGVFIYEDDRFYDQILDGAHFTGDVFDNPNKNTYFAHVSYNNLSIVVEYNGEDGGIIKMYMSPETYRQLYAEYKASKRKSANESVKTKRTSDKALLEGLVNKYGKNKLVKAINEMR